MDRASLHRIVIATGNPHKVEELRAMLALPGVEFVGLRDLPGEFPEPVETGATFEENATIKAVAYAAATGLPCLADDSGLEVDALGGAPGVISSHFSTDGRETGMSRAERDAANNARLLRELEGVSPEARSARFVCVMVLAEPPSRGGALRAPHLPDRGGALRAPHLPGRGGALRAPHLPDQGGALGAPHFSDRGEPLAAPPRGIAPEPLHARWLAPREFVARKTDLLPHWEKGGSTYALTFRLMRGELSERERQIVLDACLFWHGRRVRVHLVVVMPDHVHMIVTPIANGDGTWPSIPWLMQSVKSYSSSEVNRLRGITGNLWQDEYHDRIIRDRAEYENRLEYTGLNPVRAGLVKYWLDYPFLGGEEADRARNARQSRDPECPAPMPTRDPECPAPISGSPVLIVSRGAFEGRIGLPGEVPRGTNGFGYDPLFLVPPGYTQTSAELAPAEKNRSSHRGAAARPMLAALRRFLTAD